MRQLNRHPLRDPTRIAVMFFLLAAALASVMVWRSEKRSMAERRGDLAVVVAGHAHAIQNNVDRALSSTYALAALIRQNKGTPPNFEAVATQMLPFYPGAAALQLAPDGIVKYSVPLAGNEKAIGHNLLKDPQRNKEAIKARDTGQLTLAGPFKLVQGGFAAAGRLPVYVEDGTGGAPFWGFVAVLIRFPEALSAAHLPDLVGRGYDYELWRIHPDSGEKQVIATSTETPLREPVSQLIDVPNARWTLSVAPRVGWYEFDVLIAKILLGLLISSIVAALADSLVKLRRHRAELESEVEARTRELRDRESGLVQSEARYRALFDDNVTVMLLIDPETAQIVDANLAAATYYGYPLATLKTMRITDINTLSAQEVFAEMQNAKASGRTYFEFRHRLANGEVRAVQVSSGPMVIDGQTRLLSTVLDVTDLRHTQQLLRDSEARFRTLFESVENISVQGYDANHRVIFWNKASETLYGYRREEAMGQRLEDLIIPPAMRDDLSRAIDAWLERGIPIPPGELTLRHRNGRKVPVYSSYTMQINSRGEREMYCVGVDLSARYEAEARMREALVVFNASSQGIVTADATGVITAVNPAFSAITGYASGEVVGRTPAMMRSERHDDSFYASLLATLAASGRWQGEIWSHRKSGEIYPQWLNVSAVCDPQGQVIEYVGLFSDITERKQHEEAIWKQANFDTLTGLSNRNLLGDRIERALIQARRNEKKVGVVFLDLDGFKWVNDTLGHDVGDDLLIEVAQRLKACVREQDTAARLGGDEFTLVIQDLGSAEDMLAIGDKIVGILRQPFLLRGRQHQISGSVGITIYPDDGEDVQTLLKNADIAMYKAKQGGKNRYQFYARNMQVDAQARMQLEADLRIALAQNDFVLHYQPIVDADSGELVGAEALIRWQHAERGVISPLDFIPVAEDCGLIVPLGEWILRQSARQWHDWRVKGYPPLKLSVNVSSVQFRDPGLRPLVEELLQQYAIDPGCLVLEITESVLMDGSVEAETRMREIKSLGVGYSLDDFGTGFSSLSYLKRFPVDVVKIDRSFVNDCPGDRNDAHLVEAIINMAHSLDLRVTAEGVETEEQMEFLRDLGCDTLQGYLVGRPLPADPFEVLIQRHQLLLPTDGASLEESRFLAALREDALDVNDWLHRLLGERSPKLAAYLNEQSWNSRGLDLKQAIEAHLDWRRALDDYVGAGKSANAFKIEDAGEADHCRLGAWILAHRNSHDPCFARLDRVHREFHLMAGQIVNDFRVGHRDLARRTLASVRFRRASRDVVVALIDCHLAESSDPARG